MAKQFKLIQGRKQDLTNVVKRVKLGLITAEVVDLEEVINNMSSEDGRKYIETKFNLLENNRIQGKLYDARAILKHLTEVPELHQYIRVSLIDISNRVKNIQKLNAVSDKVNGVLYHGILLDDLISTISYDVFNCNPSTDVQEIFSNYEVKSKSDWMCYSAKFKDYILDPEALEYFIDKSVNIDKSYKEEVVNHIKLKIEEIMPKLSIK